MESIEPSLKRRRTGVTEDKIPEVVTLPVFKVPDLLKDHFEYVGTTGAGTSRRTLLKCIHCAMQLKMRANETFTCRRHLTTAHNVEVEKKKPVPASSTLLEHFVVPKKPASQTSTPKWFRQAVLDLVAIDGLPLSVVEGVGFQNLVTKLNPSISCHSSRTVSRHLDEDFNKLVLPSLNKHLQDLPQRSIHVTLDLWSSRACDSILGLNVSYISPSWKLHRRCLAFEQFPGSHTGKNIEAKVRSILERRKIKMSQVGKVMADNASNMVAAFNLTTILNGNWKPVSSSTEEDEASSEEDIDEDTFEVEEEEPNRIKFSWERLGCCAHSLQLCVKAAVKNDASAKHAIEQVNQVIMFFRRSNQAMQELKERTKSRRGLLLPGRTRWNSIFHAMKRLLKDDVFTAVMEILHLPQNSRTRRVPTFTESIKPQLEELIELLEPMNVATNRLQGDTVTSSLVIPSLLETYTEVKNVKCSYFPVLQDVLIQQLKQRFETTLSEKTFIVSTILDPRMKSRIFRATFPPDFSPVTEEIARLSITELFNESRSDDPVLQPVEPEVSELGTKKKASKDLFAFLDSVAPLEPVQRTELEIYLGEPVSAKDNCPLLFWKENSARFPVLSGLAQIFLGIPASSGDVERLFSIAGSILRARRSTITPQRLEQILLYRDYRLPMLTINVNN